MGLGQDGPFKSEKIGFGLTVSLILKGVFNYVHFPSIKKKPMLYDAI